MYRGNGQMLAVRYVENMNVMGRKTKLMLII